MKRLAVVILVAVACGNSASSTDAGQGVVCSDLEQMIPFSSQRMADCTVPLMPPGRSTCPEAVGTSCGSPSTCGSGWDVVCNPPSGGSNCIANPSVACTVNGSAATYHYVVTYNGADGVIEQVGSNRCEFVKCQ